MIPSIPKKFSVEKIVDVSEIDQQRCLKERGLWLENVDQAHLVLASGKLVPQIRQKHDQLTKSNN